MLVTIIFLLPLLSNSTDAFIWQHERRHVLPMKNALAKSSPFNTSPTSRGLRSTTRFSIAKVAHDRFLFRLFEVPLSKNRSTEKLIDSWCTKTRCRISPRTYFHAVSTNYSLVGFTDNQNEGHVWLLDEAFRPFHRIKTSIEGRPAAVAGLYGFYDQRFAAMLYEDAESFLDRKMWLQFYRPDHSVEWTALLNSPISVPDRNIGDFRLTYGEGFYMAYFSVFGISNFANGSNGDQTVFVDENGKVKTNSFNVPEQTFVKTGDVWGCSHSLAQLAAYHTRENQFAVICSGDNFPEGISAGDSETGALIFRADADGRGSTSAQLGQIAESQHGFKILFNAENSCKTEACDCCSAKGIGFTTIFNDKNKLTDVRDIDQVLWLTSSNGTSERDPVMARMYIGSNLYKTRERFLVGWYDTFENEYILGIVNKYGKFVKPPTSVSGFPIFNSSDFRCESHCVAWGNRDDSLKTLPNGHVGWVFAPPLSRSIWIYDVSIEGISVSGWSLWSGWSQCSRSCGGGVSNRIRSCLSETCLEGDNIERKDCNLDQCKIPITCNFHYVDQHKLEGDLFLNGERVFGFTAVSAQEKCSLLRDVCRGITRTITNGVPFYFLRTGTALMPQTNSTSAKMDCQETPGWSKWSTWFACSVPCGSGTQVRRQFCDGDEPESIVCPGTMLEESQLCNTGRCPHWSGWNPWTLCSTSCDIGIQYRSRVCAGDYPDQCGVLIGPFDDAQNCSLGVCPSWTTWLNWSTCSVSCGNGSQVRSRNCSGDFPCPLENGVGSRAEKPCFLGKCAYWSDWLEWSSCSESCGNSTRVRSRQCLGNYNFDQGCPLTGSFTEDEFCNLGVCPYWSIWENWGACSASCGNGTQSRIRECLGDFLSELCDAFGNLLETKDCNLGVCGYLGDWEKWGGCSTTCDAGIQQRFRQCLGDFPCSLIEPLSEDKHCNFGACPSWSVWGSWGPCSLTCGIGGFRRRTRRCLGDFPELCPEEDVWDNGPCNTLPDCPKWNDWSFWGDCSTTCDSGIVERRRRCKASILESCNRDDPASEPPLVDAKNVSTLQALTGDFVQTETHWCNRGRCSYWLDWVTWSDCSASCDRGFQTRSRECFGDFMHMCYSNGVDSETRFCSVGRCGVWAHWMPWSECSRTCGAGVWSRKRKCIGDFSETCVGRDSETSSCDVTDCIDVCMPNPCKNGGICRSNNHLTRLYHCLCTPEWMGKHCDLSGPEVLCGSDNIVISFDRKVVERENLISDDPGLVSLLSRDSVACTAMFDHFNSTEYYLIVAPSPIDTSCGSYMQVSQSAYVIRNQVIWQVEDSTIRSTVVLIDFTCMYLKNVTVSSAAASSGASDSTPPIGSITIDSFHREVKLITADGSFDVDISLFRDSNLEQMIFPRAQNTFVSLAEGEIVYVSVDLRSQNLLPSDDAVIVMDTCFVTSLQSNQDPMVYLIENSCPSSAFVTVLSNGVSRFGRFMVRIFGWTGRDRTAENVFIHCAVSVCNQKEDVCTPDCNRVLERKKRSFSDTKERMDVSPQLKEALHKQRKRNRMKGEIDTKNNYSWKMTSLSPNGHPYTKVTKVIPPRPDGRPNLNFSKSLSNFDPSHLVSVGPLEVFLKTNSRKVRDIQNKQQKPVYKYGLWIKTKTSFLPFPLLMLVFLLGSIVIRRL